MREELERLLEQYRFEINDERTISNIKHVIETFLTRKINLMEIYDFKVEDRTMFNDENNLYFQIIYQPTRIPDFRVIDITFLLVLFRQIIYNITVSVIVGEVWNQELKISDFEKNVIGDRNIKKLKI